MKILIAYYSKGGGTEKMADAIKKEFEARAHTVDVEKIMPQKEYSFLGWWNIRMFRSECKIQPLKIGNVSKYDVICIGTPNWTRLSLPVARYLKEVQGIKYKNIGCFSTTAAPPQIEWYFISTYLLGVTFSKAVSDAGGKIIENIMLSSIFKHWGVFSKYGNKIIKAFCDKMERPPESVKEYMPKQKEIEGNRFIVSAVLVFGLLLSLFQIISKFLGKMIFPTDIFFIIFATTIVVYVLILLLMTRSRSIFLAKYIFIVYLVVIWTFFVYFFELNLFRIIILGYIILLMFSFFFKSAKVSIFGGFCAVSAYSCLFLSLSKKIDFFPGVDIPIIIISVIVITFVNFDLGRSFISLLKVQDEIEEAKMTLEIKILARTRELRETADTLEINVKERTSELREKIEELERFNKVAVGRELKMIELKKEIKSLSEELERCRKT